MLGLGLADSKILYFWYVLESIHKFIIELHVLQCLLVRGSNKKQRRSRIISNLTKGRLFYLLWQPSALGGNLTMYSLYCTFQKSPSSHLQFGHEENIYGRTLNWKQSFLIYFEIGCSLFSREGIGWWTFL